MNSPLAPNSADALLFDLGRVVLDIDFPKALAAGPVTPAASPPTSPRGLSADETYQHHETGKIADADSFESLRELARHRHLGRPVPGGVECDLRRRNARASRRCWRAPRRRLPLYAFSNTNSAHVEYFSKAYADVLGHFREIFLSSTIGLRKPDAAAYDHVVKAIGVPASRIVFFDDLAENIEGARAWGLDRRSCDVTR